MARWLSFLIFFVVSLLVVSGWHYYLWLRLVRDPAWSAAVTRALTWLLIGLGLALPLGLVLSRLVPGTLSRAFGWFAFVWMGGGFILLVLVATGDLFTFILRKASELPLFGSDAAPVDPLPHYIPPNENPRTAPMLATRYPLSLISPKSHAFLNSNYGNLPAQTAQAGEEQAVLLNPDDAAQRGIVAGAPIRVFNDRGAFEAFATVSADVMPGVVVAPSGYWQRSNRRARRFTC